MEAVFFSLLWIIVLNFFISSWSLFSISSLFTALVFYSLPFLLNLFGSLLIEDMTPRVQFKIIGSAILNQIPRVFKLWVRTLFFRIRFGTRYGIWKKIFFIKILNVYASNLIISEHQRYFHLFAVSFNKILIKYIFGIFEDSDFWILHLRMIIPYFR